MGHASTLIPDFWGCIVGVLSTYAIFFVFRHSDELSDGNVGADQ